MSDSGEFDNSNDWEFDRLLEFELDPINKLVDQIMEKPTRGDPTFYNWNNHMLERHATDKVREILIATTFQTEPTDGTTLIKEYVLSLTDGVFFVIRERHDQVVIHQSLYAHMPIETVKMLKTLGQLKPDDNDVHDLEQVLIDAKFNQDIQRDPSLAAALGKSATGRKIHIEGI